MKKRTYKNCYFYDAGETITVKTATKVITYINKDDLIYTTTNHNQIEKLQVAHNDIFYTFKANPEAPYIQ